MGNYNKKRRKFKIDKNYKEWFRYIEYLSNKLNEEIRIFNIEKSERNETQFIHWLQHILKTKGIKSLKQATVLNYKIDLYIPMFNIAIEYDENHHKSPNNQCKDHIRQTKIQEKIKCEFIRCDQSESNKYNVYKVINIINSRLKYIETENKRNMVINL